MTHTVRRVLPYEYDSYRTHLKKLDQDSKILRFGYSVSDQIVDMLCDSIEKNNSNHILFCVENDLLEFIGVGHIAIENGQMELAFSVFKEYQGQGIGTALMERCIQWCRIHNILEGHMVCLSQNRAIRHLCRKHGITMENEHGETTATIKLPRADLFTYIGESISRNTAIMNWISNRSLRLVKPSRQLEAQQRSSL